MSDSEEDVDLEEEIEGVEVEVLMDEEDGSEYQQCIIS